MADIPDVPDLNSVNPSRLGGLPSTQAQPGREVVASLRSFQPPMPSPRQFTPTPEPNQANDNWANIENISRLDAAPVDAGINEQTIQIAPHPTTNRFPWTPIENPRVPIMPPPIMVPEPDPVVSEPAPVPVPQPILFAAQPQPLPAEEQPVAPPAAPVPPTLQTPPIPILPPVEVAMPLAVEPPLAPVEPPKPIEPVAVAVAQSAALSPPISTPLAHKPALPVPSGHKPVQIYSDYTRQAWHVFRPNRLIRLMLLIFVLLIIVGGIIVWVASGAPTDIQKLPFLQSLLHAE